MKRLMLLGLACLLLAGMACEGEEAMARTTVRPGQTTTLTIEAAIGEAGKHGALTITTCELRRSDGSVLDLTPASIILREQGTGGGGTGTVGSPPSFSAGGGPAGEDVYSVALGTGEASDISVGNYIRSTTANLGGVYKVLAKSSDTLKLHAGTGEMDIANGHAVEKVTPTGLYVADIDLTYANLNGQDGVLVAEIVGSAAADRGNTPAVSTAFTDSRRMAMGVASPLALSTAFASTVA